jgi:hypothetical protein
MVAVGWVEIAWLEVASGNTVRAQLTEVGANPVEDREEPGMNGETS